MAKTKKKKPADGGSTIALNRKAKFDYQIDERFEAGLSLMGWEVKSLRASKVQLNDSYVFIRNAEAYLVACHIAPLLSASTHVQTDPMRMRKLLLHRRELNRSVGAVERKGFTLVPMALYWKNGRVKLEVGLGKGKKEHDKRATQKDRDWQRDKQRELRR